MQIVAKKTDILSHCKETGGVNEQFCHRRCRNHFNLIGHDQAFFADQGNAAVKERHSGSRLNIPHMLKSSVEGLDLTLLFNPLFQYCLGSTVQFPVSRPRLALPIDGILNWTIRRVKGGSVASNKGRI